MFEVVEVKTRKDLRRFVAFPDELYKDCPQYVPAMHADQVKSLTRAAISSTDSRLAMSQDR